MIIKNAWYDGSLSTEIVVETTDGKKHLTALSPYRVVAENELRPYLSPKRHRKADEIPDYALKLYGFEKQGEDVPSAIKEIRKKTGLSQEGFAAKYHIPRRTIENWESGYNECPPYVLELLDFRVSHEYE